MFGLRMFGDNGFGGKAAKKINPAGIERRARKENKDKESRRSMKKISRRKNRRS